ncbi:MAG: hypothetical protein ACI8ZM_000578 [Crocinitomix sp.]|jgi:hypothetical protein
MKIFGYLSLLCLNVLLIVSCSINKDFSKRKYLHLKANVFQSNEESVPNTSNVLSIVIPFSDTIDLKNGNSILRETNISEKASIIHDFHEKENTNTFFEMGLHEVNTSDMAQVDPIIVDSTDTNKEIQKEEEKANQTKNPKRIAWIILRLISSIIIITAGILLGVQILKYNKPNGSFLSGLWYVMVAIAAIAIMIIASIIGLFILLSLVAP